MSPTSEAPGLAWRLDGELRTAARDEGGFLTAELVAELAGCETFRLFQLLIRWHQGRAVVAAQDVASIITATEAGGWTVRDVSIPADQCEQLARRQVADFTVIGLNLRVAIATF